LFLQFADSRFAAIQGIFIYCTATKIIGLFVTFVDKVILLAAPAQGFALLQRVFSLLPAAANTSWRQVSKIALCVQGALTGSVERRGLRLPMVWLRRLWIL
jgi:hypothetical protein